MTPPLQLEYAVTEADWKEAHLLHARSRYGSRAFWRRWSFRVLLFAGFLTLVYFRIRDQVPARNQPYFLAGAALLLVVFHTWGSRKKKEAKPVKLEMTEKEVSIVNGASRISMLWSGFSQCLESTNLFVLVDQPGKMLVAVPKRAFPDEPMQSWFRAQATYGRSSAETQLAPTLAATEPAGIALSYQLSYRDHLERYLASWRMRGIIILVFAVVAGSCLYFAAHPSPTEVNPPGKVFLIMGSALAVMMSAMVLGIAYLSLRVDPRCGVTRRVVLSEQGLEFMNSHERGVLPWTGFTYYLENRVCFILWNPRTPGWDLLPKRAFASRADLEGCRTLLHSRLRRSGWFFL